MRLHMLSFALVFTALSVSSQTQFKFEDGYSLTYEETISAYTLLAEKYLNCQFEAKGLSDSGRPIYLFSTGKAENGLPTLLINNGIHPGESCGIDASLMLIEELLRSDSPILSRLNIAIISIYNVGGSLNRGCCTRANQNGPVEQGFRGNARNLDLNRDFIKMDSRNAETFVKIFHEWEPELFVDTHTSNGADYQHTMTLIHSQFDMISQHLKRSYENTLIPYLYEQMEPHYPMVPYMDMIGATPDEGIRDFPDWPRYSTGYAGLFNCFGFTTEAHMLKPYRDRVLATYHFIKALAKYGADHSAELVKNKAAAVRSDLGEQTFFLDYNLDTTRVDSVRLLGFEAKYKTSEVTGLERLYYDRNSPYEKMIPRLKTLVGRESVAVPTYYIIPQAWKEVIDKLKRNGVEMTALEQDTTILVEAYYITDIKSPTSPYEGHFIHTDVETRLEEQKVDFFAGDLLIPSRQAAKRYLINVLEPKAKDSFFAWNYFDEILQQKEWFSPYVFEDMAAEMLNTDPVLKKEFDSKKENPEFAQNMWAQLYFIYSRSPYYEKSHKRYPVFRIK